MLDIATMVGIRVVFIWAVANALFLLLAGCRTSSSAAQRTPTPRTTGLPDSVAYRPYRLLLVQLATADWQDRQALFRVFKVHGFKSAAADSANRWLMRQDASRLHGFQAVERRYGWPRAATAGKEAVGQAYLLIQHAPETVHASYQDTLRAAYERGDLSGFNYATYLDRLLHNQHKPQRYGTQRGRRVLKNGQTEDYLFPVEDIAELDHRRATMQLDPILPRLQPGTLILQSAGK